MGAEASLKSKMLYKTELFLIKTIPIIISVLSLLNSILSYFGYDITLFSYIGGISLLTIILLYISSIVFRFCLWHRMFIHYITINWIISTIDYNFYIPISDRNMFLLYIILAGIFFLSAIYFKLKGYENIKILYKAFKRNS